mmetsp:Transcript_1472/g.3969  ORF Transcript_1472/g.3969 Transcript_1472/m.3969 type:complete len:1120 (-) Transcript_1472:353-3712(-)
MTDNHAPGNVTSISPLCHTTDETLSTPSCAWHQASDSERNSDPQVKSKSRSRLFTSPKMSFSLFSAKSKESAEKSPPSPTCDHDKSTVSPIRLYANQQWWSHPSIVTWNLKMNVQQSTNLFQEWRVEAVTPQQVSRSNVSSSCDTTVASNHTTCKDASHVNVTPCKSPSNDSESEVRSQPSPPEMFSWNISGVRTEDELSSFSRQDSADSKVAKSSFLSNVMKRISSAVKPSKNDPLEQLRTRTIEAYKRLELAKMHFEEAERRASDTEARYSTDLVNAVEQLSKAEAAAKKWNWLSFSSSKPSGDHDIMHFKAQVIEVKRVLEELRAAATADLDVLRRRVVEAQEEYNKYSNDPRLAEALDDSRSVSSVRSDLSSQTSKPFMSYLSPKMSFNFLGAKRDRYDDNMIDAPTFSSLPSVVTWYTVNSKPHTNLGPPQEGQPILGAKLSTKERIFGRSLSESVRHTKNPQNSSSSGGMGSKMSFSFFSLKSSSSSLPNLREAADDLEKNHSVPGFCSMPSVVTWYIPTKSREFAGRRGVQEPESQGGASWLPKVSIGASSVSLSSSSAKSSTSSSTKSSYFNFSPKISFSFFSSKTETLKSKSEPSKGDNGFRNQPSVVTWYNPPVNHEAKKQMVIDISEAEIAVGKQTAIVQPHWTSQPSVVTWYSRARVPLANERGNAASNPPQNSGDELGGNVGSSSSGIFGGWFSMMGHSPARREKSKHITFEEVATKQMMHETDIVESNVSAAGAQEQNAVQAPHLDLDGGQMVDQIEVAVKLKESRHRKQASLSEARRSRLRQGNYSYSDTWNFRQLPLDAFVDDFLALYPTSGLNTPAHAWDGLSEVNGPVDLDPSGPEVNKQFMRDAPCMVKINGQAPVGRTPEEQALAAYKSILRLCRHYWGDSARDGQPVRDAATGRFIVSDGLSRLLPVKPSGATVRSSGTSSPRGSAEERTREIMLLANQNMGILLYEEVTLAHPDYVVLQTGRHGVDIVLKDLDRTVECRAVFELFYDSELASIHGASAHTSREFDRKFVSARAVVDFCARNVFISQSQPYDDSVVRAGINRQSMASPLLLGQMDPAASPPLIAEQEAEGDCLPGDDADAGPAAPGAGSKGRRRRRPS